MTFIYALIDPRDNEIRYIGKADNPEQRHRYHHAPSQLAIHKTPKNSWLLALADLGLQAGLRVLAEVDDDRWQEAERGWIAMAHRAGFDLLNGTRGGDGGAITDPEALERISASMKRRRWDFEEKRKAAAADAQRRPEQRAKMREIALRNGNRPPTARGEQNPTSKLTDEKVAEARRRYRGGETLAQLVVDFGVTKPCLQDAIKGRTWKHVTEPPVAPRIKHSDPGQTAQMESLIRAGRSNAEVAELVGCTVEAASTKRKKLKRLDPSIPGSQPARRSSG